MDIAAFPLIWRWTQPSHAVLPADVLNAMRPTTIAKIASHYDGTTKLHDPQVIKHQATKNAQETRRWLASLYLPSGRVIAVWNKDTALSMPWETFVTYWSDFCYPSSDDVDVFVEDWPPVLRWRHDEIFEYYGDAL
jgi:hypothetical protein